MGNNAKRLFPIFGTVIVVTVCSAVLVFWMGLQVTRANLEVIRIRDMRGGIDDMLANLHEAETWQRYFLLTGEEKYVAQYQAALQRTRDHQAHILHWSRSGLLSSAAEKALASLIDDRIADLQRAIGLRRDKGADAALATMRNDAASSMMEDMQREVGLLKTEANRQLDASEQRRDTATFMRTSTSVGMALINLAFLGWAFFRVRAEIAKTSDQKKLLGVTLASIGDGVIVTDFSGKITFLNTEAERLTGWKNQEAQGHSLPEVFHIINEHTRQIVESPVDKVLRLGVVVGLANHTLLIARDGRETPIDDSGAPIRAEDGKMYGVVLVFRDFTAQKIAERGLARLATIVESTDDPILSKDLQGNILTWNSAAQRLLGYSSQEVVGKSVTMLLPVERQAEESQILERIRRGEQVERYETVRLAKDGRRVEVSVTISPIRDHEGQIIGASKIMRDITSRKAVERALRNNEELLRIFVWHTPAAVAMFDRDMRYLVVSKRWMLDYGLGEQNIIGRSHYEVFPDMPARWREIHQRCLAGAQEKCEEDPFPRADGRVDWVRWEVHPWRSGNEQIGGIIIFSEVITERKRAQQAMWQSSEQRRVALEAADLGAWDYRFDTGEVYWDDRCREMFGLPAGNKIPYDAAINVIHPEDRQATNEEVSQVLAGKNNGVYFREYRVIWPDGSQHWISSHGRVYFEGEGANRRAVRFIGVNMDITQRRQAREMLAQRQAMLDAVCEGTDDAIFVKDREGRLLLANPATLKVIGKPLEQVLGHRDDEFYADQETGAAILANDRRIMESGVSETVEECVKSVQGTRTFLSVKSPWRDGAGRVIGLVGVARDITVRKEVENELKTANSAKDHFLAVLSHELRTPLTPVLALVSMMREDLTLDRDTRENLDMIQRNVELEARLIDDLLDVTRIARGKIELDRQRVDLGAILRHAVEVCLPDIEAKELQFQLHLEPQTACWVNADSSRLQQVFWNLIKNAVKFTPKHGSVSINCRHDGVDQWLVEVKDSGEGIEASVLPRLFSAFEQGGRDITRQFGGLGLGLVISKTLVELHGGILAAHSEGRGKGAVFTVRLPAAVANPAVQSEQKPSDKSVAMGTNGGRRFQILLVEDHADTLRIMQRLLSREGHHVQTASEVAQAVQLAQANRYDLLISDLGLPDGSGMDLLQTLRKSGLNLPAIALSGFGREDDVQKCLEAGFNTHLTKPVKFGSLLQTIQTVMASRAKN